MAGANETPVLFAATGGLSFGLNSWFASGSRFPSAFMTIYRDRIIIEDKLFMYYRKFEFLKEDLAEIRFTRIVLARGVRIAHRCESYPPYILFISCLSREIIEVLKDAHYPVAPTVALWQRLRRLLG